MLHLLKRHPIPISAFFRHSLVLTYALSREVLEPLLSKLHFFSRREWRNAASEAGSMVRTEMEMTPFVHAYVLRENS